MNVLTLIPARAGSTGVPGKNVRPVYGKPLIAWAIECALHSRGTGTIVVSSDDPVALEIARQYADVTALDRPAHLASATTPSTDVVAHALQETERAGPARFDAVLLLQPTAPIRESRHVEEALAMLRGDVASVISVVEVRDAHPARMYNRDGDGMLVPLIPELEQARRQDIPPAYLRNGAIYVVRRDAFEAQGAIMAKPAAGYVMDSRFHCNIDEPRDLILAEALVAAWQEGRL